MKIDTILLILAFVIIYLIGFTNISNKSETFDNSTNIIYDTIPYANSGLYYNYMMGSPYLYNPLDYWLNPYYYTLPWSWQWNTSSPTYIPNVVTTTPYHKTYRMHKRDKIHRTNQTHRTNRTRKP